MALVSADADLKRYRIASAEQCAEWVRALVAIEDRWLKRGPAFFTLGAAAYLDLCSQAGSRTLYDQRARAANPLIHEHFSSLLDAVAEQVSVYVGGSCQFAGGWALPGFHIFRHASLQQTLRDNFHLDLQFMRLSLKADLDTPSVTFTLPIENPANGAGLELCRVVADKPAGETRVEPYYVGELLVHTGRELHRRAHYPASMSCQRITLQGHGIKEDGTWLLYW
jgi:hypothetical protein